jgi:hypothetical protein
VDDDLHASIGDSTVDTYLTAFKAIFAKFERKLLAVLDSKVKKKTTLRVKGSRRKS